MIGKNQSPYFIGSSEAKKEILLEDYQPQNHYKDFTPESNQWEAGYFDRWEMERKDSA